MSIYAMGCSVLPDVKLDVLGCNVRTLYLSLASECTIHNVIDHVIDIYPVAQYEVSVIATSFITTVW